MLPAHCTCYVSLEFVLSASTATFIKDYTEMSDARATLTV